MGMCVLLVGNPVSGFRVVGPFKTGVDALAWSDEDEHSHLETWLAPLKAPDDYHEDE